MISELELDVKVLTTARQKAVYQIWNNLKLTQTIQSSNSVSFTGLEATLIATIFNWIELIDTIVYTMMTGHYEVN